MNIVSLIQPSELGADFELVAGVWTVKFPTTATPPPPISNDARNIILNNADGMFVDKRDRLAYALVQDNDTQKIRLYQHPTDVAFDVATATLASEIDMLAMNGQFDDIAIDEGVITFTDAQSGLTLTLNTNELQRVGSLKSSNSIKVAEEAGILRLTANLDPNVNNLLKTTAGGLQVNTTDIDALFNSKLAAADIHTQEMFELVDFGVGHVIGDQIIEIPKVMLANSAGVGIAMVNDPNALVQSNNYDYPDYVDIASFIDGEGDRQNYNIANFSLSIDGQPYFASKPDLIQEDVATVTNSDVSVVLQDMGIIRVMSRHNHDGFVTIVLSPSAEQRTYSNKFLDVYRGAKVLANGDFEFKLVTYIDR